MPADKYFAILHPEKGLVGELDSDGTKTFPNEKNPNGIILDLTAIRHTEQQAETWCDENHPDCEVVYVYISTHVVKRKK